MRPAVARETRGCRSVYVLGARALRASRVRLQPLPEAVLSAAQPSTLQVLRGRSMMARRLAIAFLPGVGQRGAHAEGWRLLAGVVPPRRKGGLTAR